MRKLNFYLNALLAATLTLSACNSSAPPKTVKQPKPAEYLSGREAFQTLYSAAHSIAADVEPYRMESRYTKDSPAGGGKSGLWRADFASPSKKLSKTFSWSGLTGPNAPERGVSHGADDIFNPGNSTTHIFTPQFLKIDSAQALEVAQKHGGAKLTGADPGQPIFYMLDFDARKNQLIWHVIYGTNQFDAKLTVFVDATTGEFLREEK